MKHLLFLLLLVSTAQAQTLGVTSFENSGSAEAQEPFLRGLLQLHSFEYDDALDAFQEAQAADPSFAMAYWGEAMTHNHPIWMQQDREAARAALGRMPASARASTRERAYLDAANVLFGDGEKDERDDRFEAAMGLLAAAYPDDSDAASLHALSILGTSHEGRDFDVYGRAAAIAQAVFEAHPTHPGAAHYLIHAFDDPEHAALALDAANAYSKIAPSASHALHMPTHIFYALGKWEDAVALNIRAYEAARDASARRGEPLNGHGWHALYWLAYAQLQLGWRSDAMRTFELSRATYATDSTAVALRHLTYIRAQIAVDAALASILVPVSATLVLSRAQMDPGTRAIDIFALAMAEWIQDEPSPARLAQAQVELAEIAASEDASESSKSLALVFEAIRAGDASQSEVEIARLVSAVNLIETTPITFGPPSLLVYPQEMLALASGAHGDMEAANCLLRATADRAPNRVVSRRVRDMLDQMELPARPVRVQRATVCAE